MTRASHITVSFIILEIILNFSYDVIESINMSKLGKWCEAFTIKGSASIIIDTKTEIYFVFTAIQVLLVKLYTFFTFRFRNCLAELD